MWERENRILDADWAAGDDAELARRYTAATKAQIAKSATGVSDDVRLEQVRQAYYRSRSLDAAAARARQIVGVDRPNWTLAYFRNAGFGSVESLRLAIQDLIATFGERYPRGAEFLQRLDAIEQSLRQAGGLGRTALTTRGQGDVQEESDHSASLEVGASAPVSQFDQLQREALLANPLLDFQRLLLIRRAPAGDPRRQDGTGYGLGEYLGLPRQSSKCNPGIERPFDWDNEIAVLEPVRSEGHFKVVYKPDRRRLITDIDLHWDGDRLLFSMPGTHDKWQVFEVCVDGSGLRQVTPGDQPDVHSYDGCYLPNGRIAFISTAPLQGVPCNAGVIVGMMYLMDADGRNIRQVCFEQDHDYCPTMLNNGRVLYLRWDYTDTPHVWNRMLFSMNPDGTDQMEFYGANSYWPNAVFYARPIPNHPTQVVGIVTGHHVGRVGELVLFDPARGRRDADGVVQRIPGRGQRVEPVIEDKLTEHSWPKFLHPFPLSDKYFLVSCKPTPHSLWGIYVVDVFDNMTLVKEVEGQALLEPIPLRSTPRPPVIPDKTDPERKDALIYLANVYEGPGLNGVPRGAVKSLRVFSYHFGYQRIAGIDHRVGTDGPWEVKRILGTVPVEADGSVLFRVPAKTPLSVQPLDAEGKALQLMRSWMTAMPGETLSCIGCHDHRNTSPPSRATIAARRAPREISPWYGPARNFGFEREVQPVLEKYCVGCHDGQPQPGGRTLVDLRSEQGRFLCFRGDDPRLKDVPAAARDELMGKYGGIFVPSYIALRSLVRVYGLESDLRALSVGEFHADTTELIQMLRKGHHGVQLDREAWDRLITWIDLNAPEHAAWSQFVGIPGDQRQRRCQLRKLFGGVEEDGEERTPAPAPPARPPVARRTVTRPQVTLVSLPQFPLDANAAAERQAAVGPSTRTVDLGEGVSLELARIPAGSFIMGSADGPADEFPPSVVPIDRPLWMSRYEVTNEQFAQFDPQHESRYEHRGSWIFSEEYLGWPLDRPRQPVVRVSWNEATAFCRWLSAKTGLRFALPTEAQWEYACRAGTATPFSFGTADADFSPFANLADVTIRDLAHKSWGPRTPDIVPRDERFDDGMLVSADVGHFKPNVWGLYDMHGNVAEWTRSVFQPHPDRDHDGRKAVSADEPRVVRGGSWRDRPARATSSFRLAYPPYHRVFNVGFRVVCEEP